VVDCAARARRTPWRARWGASAARHRDLGELARDLQEVGLAVEESEPARLRLLDHRELDAVDERQALSAQARSGLARGNVPAPVAGLGLLVVDRLVVRVALEHDARAPLPLD
jgi:hypothetical protein